MGRTSYSIYLFVLFTRASYDCQPIPHTPGQKSQLRLVKIVMIGHETRNCISHYSVAVSDLVFVRHWPPADARLPRLLLMIQTSLHFLQRRLQLHILTEYLTLRELLCCGLLGAKHNTFAIFFLFLVCLLIKTDIYNKIHKYTRGGGVRSVNNIYSPYHSVAHLVKVS